MIKFLFGGFRRCDSHYNLHIAEYLRKYSSILSVISYFRKYINKFYVSIAFIPWLAFQATVLVCAVFLKVSFFCLAAHFLVQLSRLVSKNSKMAITAGYLFCISRASIFLTIFWKLICFDNIHIIYESELKASQRTLNLIHNIRVRVLIAIGSLTYYFHLWTPLYIMAKKNYEVIISEFTFI